MQQTAQTPQAPRPAAQARPAQEAATPRPTTAAELAHQIQQDAAMEGLRIRRGEIQAQIRDLTARRNELNSQRQSMSLEAGRGHDERIRVIDQRSAQLERQLLQLDEQIASGITSVVSERGEGDGSRAVAGTTEQQSDDLIREMRRAASNGAEDGAISALAGTGTFLFFAFLLYQGVRRWIWKRKPAAAVTTGSADAQQIAQLQRSLDVVAVEVERIAEAQRYVAKLLNDRALGAGDAQPVHSRGAVNADPVERR